MNINSRFGGGVRKGDIILIALLICLCIFLFILPLLSQGSALTAEVYSDGELVCQRQLSSLKKAETISVKGCEILLETDGVSFTHSTCPDGLCVKRGKLSLIGDTMACVPEGVTVLLVGEADLDFDAISY